MPAFLKPSVQRRMATNATSFGAIAVWVEQGPCEPELLRGEGRRYFGQSQPSIFRASATWTRRRGLSNL